MNEILTVLTAVDDGLPTTFLRRKIKPLLQLDPGSVLWLVPTQRAVDDLRTQFLAQHRALVGLRLTTTSELASAVLADEAIPTPSLSSAQKRLLLEEIVADLVAQGELRHFARVVETTGFIEGLLGLFSELSRTDISPGDFAAAVQQVSPTSAIRQKHRECALLYTRYHRELTRLGVADPESLESRAATYIATSQSSLFDGVTTLILTGFHDAGLGQFRLLSACVKRFNEVYLTLLDEPGNLREELFTRSRLFLSRLSEFSLHKEHLEDPPTPLQPAGLHHLRSQLFRPLRQVERSIDAEGLQIIEAPGMVGEVRLVLREVKGLLLAGVAPEQILLVSRDITPYADLLRELSQEYELPLEIEGTEPLSRHPLITLLLRSVRLPEDDFPFAGVTALLRHNAFRPTWPEFAEEPDLASRSEALLRLLGEPRGREAYLASIARWAEKEQPGLEDESAEESSRKLTHQLAKECQGFLTRFFASWDHMSTRAPLRDHLTWLKEFTDSLGLAQTAQESDDDLQAWNALWEELNAWQQRDQRKAPLDHRTFLRRLVALCSQLGLPRSPAGSDRVRVLSAVQAQYLSVSYQFILGLGERGFPQLHAENSIFDEADRQTLSQANLELPDTPTRYSDEMLLFYRLVTSTRQRLTLSYPAVDARGQELLPSSFLLAVKDCFTPVSVPVVRHEMLIQQVLTSRPLSRGEYRLRVGLTWPIGSEHLSPTVRESLTDAAMMLRARFHEREFTAYDGKFTDRFLIEWVGKQFGQKHVYSPTALEDYVACPFKFFLRHVLHLEPLEQPREQIEVTRKGMTYHRALARLHRRLREEGTHTPTAGVDVEVLREMTVAVDEDIERAPGPASKELWRLEGQRLLRSAGKYPEQWGKFLQPWHSAGISPTPHFFEVDFGLPPAEGQPAFGPLVLSADGVEVRVWGRIDRVDVAETTDGLGFWIIDYKTGRASNYTGSDLSSFRKLQLTLYAVAVEGVLFADQQARPLGMAYWLVSDTGPKVVLPGGRTPTAWLEQMDRWPTIREQLTRWVVTLVREVRQGNFSLAPRSEYCTQTCPYGSVCRIGQSRVVGKVMDLPLPGEG